MEEEEERVIKSKSFSKHSLEGQNFESCSFISCDFSQAVLRGVKFSFCTFFSCNLSLPKLDHCRFQDVGFADCKIVGADFFRCEKQFFSPSFTNSFLHYCNFSDLNMKKSVFSGCKIQENYFTNTILQEAEFKETDLLGTVFHGCDLSKADFSTARNYAIDPQANKIKKAKFSLPEAMGLLHGFDIILV